MSKRRVELPPDLYVPPQAAWKQRLGCDQVQVLSMRQEMLRQQEKTTAMWLPQLAFLQVTSQRHPLR